MTQEDAWHDTSLAFSHAGTFYLFPRNLTGDGSVYFTPRFSRAEWNSSPGFQVGNPSALATARATSRVNRANTTKPEKSQSALNSSCGEWYALSLNSLNALLAKSFGLPLIFMPVATENAGTPACAIEKWSER